MTVEKGAGAGPGDRQGEESRRRTQSAVVSGIFARRTGPVKLDATDAAHLVLGHVPSPCCHGIPLFDRDFHDGNQMRSAGLSRDP